jgi:hypothetical protein
VARREGGDVSRLQLSLFAGQVTDAPADTIVALVPQDERPLRGDAGRVDWRLCGRISEQLVKGYVSGVPGEAVLLPAGKPLRSDRLLLVGVGPRSRILQGRPLLRAMRVVADRLLSLRSRSALLAWPGSIDFEADAANLLRGLVHGLQAAPEGSVLHVILPSAEQAEKALLAALSDVVPGAHAWGIDVDVHWAEA